MELCQLHDHYFDSSGSSTSRRIAYALHKVPFRLITALLIVQFTICV